MSRVFHFFRSTLSDFFSTYNSMFETQQQRTMDNTQTADAANVSSLSQQPLNVNVPAAVMLDTTSDESIYANNKTNNNNEALFQNCNNLTMSASPLTTTTNDGNVLPRNNNNNKDNSNKDKDNNNNIQDSPDTVIDIAIAAEEKEGASSNNTAKKTIDFAPVTSTNATSDHHHHRHHHHQHSISIHPTVQDVVLNNEKNDFANNYFVRLIQKHSQAFSLASSNLAAQTRIVQSIILAQRKEMGSKFFEKKSSTTQNHHQQQYEYYIELSQDAIMLGVTKALQSSSSSLPCLPPLPLQRSHYILELAYPGSVPTTESNNNNQSITTTTNTTTTAAASSSSLDQLQFASILCLYSTPLFSFHASMYNNNNNNMETAAAAGVASSSSNSSLKNRTSSRNKKSKVQRTKKKKVSTKATTSTTAELSKKGHTGMIGTLTTKSLTQKPILKKQHQQRTAVFSSSSSSGAAATSTTTTNTATSKKRTLSAAAGGGSAGFTTTTTAGLTDTTVVNKKGCTMAWPPIETNINNKNTNSHNADSFTVAALGVDVDSMSTAELTKTAAMILQSIEVKSIPRGVTLRPSGKWQAQFYFEGSSRYIGVFDSSTQATKAYECIHCMLRKSKKSRMATSRATSTFDKVREAVISLFKTTNPYYFHGATHLTT